MNAHPHGPEPHEEELRVTGALYSALHDARPHVEVAFEHYRGLLLSDKAAAAADVLDRIDGALADAGELLPGVAS